ncbi:hypothetical protein [Actinorhabdospora filicis]|uniref:hypothetical protein n=1 Tax=Actinorhabdospora filicis TaxID=1785913 RepID=UPI002554A338|nr:hypothetical protein [Actinorhabdospora filicis]
MGAHDLGGLALGERLGRLGVPAVHGQAVQGPEGALEGAGGRRPPGGGPVQVRLAELDAADDPQVRVLPAASRQVLQMAVGVEDRRRGQAVWSTCSVKATAGMPGSATRAQARSIEPLAASPDHSPSTCPPAGGMVTDCRIRSPASRSATRRPGGV